MKRLLSVLFALVSVSACIPTPPKPPMPPATQTITISVSSPQLGGCLFHVASADATIPYGADFQQPGLPYSPAAFTSVPWAITHVNTSVLCNGYLLASQNNVVTAGDGKTSVTLGPLTPTTPPLPPIPSRDELAKIRACFQGCTAVTSQLGTIPSWGPEIGMLTSLSDRQAVYAAHKAAGATHFVIDVFVHYTEPGVAYPNGTAASNDWTTDGWKTLVSRVAEIVQAGLFPVIVRGGDELPFSTVAAQAKGMHDALAAYPGGDLNPYTVGLIGLDSVVPIANQNDDVFQTLIDAEVAIRAAIGSTGVEAFELPTGWAFAGPTDARFNYAGSGTYTGALGQSVDVILQEFDSPPGPPARAPRIVGGTWDAEHNDFAPIFDNPGLATSFMRIWQVAARARFNTYIVPPDQVTAAQCPGANTVPVTGNPSVTTACVYSDTNPSAYITTSTPRGRFYVIAFETATYSWTHGAMSASDIFASRPYFANLGTYDEVCIATIMPSGLTPPAGLTFRSQGR